LEQIATAAIIGHASFLLVTADASQFIPRGLSSCPTMKLASAYSMSRSLTSVRKFYIKLEISVSIMTVVLFLSFLPRQDQSRGPPSLPP